MKKTTAERDPAAAARLRELIDTMSVAMLTTVSPDGRLRSRPMFTEDVESEGVLWFFTSTHSAIAHDLEHEPAVNVSYADPANDRYVSVTGQAELVRERRRMEALWDEKLTRYFPEGLADPELALVSVRIEAAEFWDATARTMAPVGRGAARSSGEDVKVDVRAARTSG